MGSERPKRRFGYLVAAGAIAVIAIASVVLAAGTNPSSISGPVDTENLPDKGPAPALDAKGWINSPPLGANALTGKVVLYDIWTYSCINCVRTFPYVRVRGTTATARTGWSSSACTRRSSISKKCTATSRARSSA